MDRLVLFRSFAGALLLALAPQAMSDPSMDDNADPAAIGVVEVYLDALSTADIPTMLSTLSDEMLKEKRPIMESDSYPELLTRLYAGSSYTVQGAEPTADGDVLVSSQMLMDGGFERTFRFLVEREPDGSYKIAEEL